MNRMSCFNLRLEHQTGTLKMKRKATVSFDATTTVTIPADEQQSKLSCEERKRLWYSREELTNSCLEAKRIVQIINSVDGDYNAIDHSKVCVVGLEKWHGKKEREKYRKLLIKAVLIRQEMNRGLGRQDADCLCEISAMISSSFKEFALWQAAMHKFHANSSDLPQESQRHVESDQRPLKRQKIELEFGNSSRSQVLSGNSLPLQYPNPGQVRQEMQQMMTGFCS
mmetsp:Transcript_88693/g.255824  ORF Transcript_88693/g.255824 Transcript_88693/m.255824 type:complete len:225 (+) Transcript_88693:47-721(+)